MSGSLNQTPRSGPAGYHLAARSLPPGSPHLAPLTATRWCVCAAHIELNHRAPPKPAISCRFVPVVVRRPGGRWGLEGAGRAVNLD